MSELNPKLIDHTISWYEDNGEDETEELRQVRNLFNDLFYTLSNRYDSSWLDHSEFVVFNALFDNNDFQDPMFDPVSAKATASLKPFHAGQAIPRHPE